MRPLAPWFVIVAMGCGGGADQAPAHPVAPEPSASSSASAAPSASSSVAPPAGDPEARAREYVKLLVKHDFEGAMVSFDDKMHASLTKEKLAAAWGTIEKKLGPLERIASVERHETDGFHVILLKTRFATGTFILQVTVDGQDRIAGFFLKPL